MVLECQLAGIRIGIGREDAIFGLEGTTFITLFSKVHPMLGITPNDFTYDAQKKRITYKGISDPGVSLCRGNRPIRISRPLRSSEYTHCVVEEVGECRKKAVIVFTSRKELTSGTASWHRRQDGSDVQPHPELRPQEYYEPYKALGWS